MRDIRCILGKHKLKDVSSKSRKRVKCYHITEVRFVKGKTVRNKYSLIEYIVKDCVRPGCEYTEYNMCYI